MMKRLGIVIVVVFACGLTTSSALAAATPEWVECVKSPSGKLEKGCAKEGGKGGYEVRSGLGASAGLLVKGASVTLKTVKGHEVTCATYGEEGERVLPNLLRKVTITLKSCFKTGTHQKCYGEEEGETGKNPEITSETLAGELGYISRSPLKVGIKLSSQAEPGGPVIQKMFCGASAPFSERWKGSLVAELRGAVNVSSKKAMLGYPIGAYLGEVSPGYTPETDPPLEGEAAGGLIEESKGLGEPWGSPLPGGFSSGNLKISGTLMVGA